MKSEGMIYGSSTSGLLQAVRPGSANTGDSDPEQELPHGVREVRWSVGERAGSGGLDRGMTVLDGQHDGSQINSISPANRTASWMDLVYDVCNSCWDFEMGWLDLFRNIDYSRIANYITNSLNTDLVTDALSTWPTSTTSSTKVQPGPSSCNALVGYPDKPASSAGPRSGVFYLLGNPEEEISAVHERWMQMADDFVEQEKKPGLRAGRTSLYWRATVYVHRGKRARAWLWKAGIELSVAKPSGNKYFDKEVFLGEADDTFDEDSNDSREDYDPFGTDDDLFDADDDLLDKDDEPPLAEGDN